MSETPTRGMHDYQNDAVRLMRLALASPFVADDVASTLRQVVENAYMRGQLDATKEWNDSMTRALDQFRAPTPVPAKRPSLWRRILNLLRVPPSEGPK